MAKQLHRHTQGLVPAGSGRRLPVEQLHITLAYLGRQTVSQQQCVMAVADGIQQSPFSLALDHTGHFARARVVWLGMRHIPPALVRLQTELVSQLKNNCDYQPEARPFVPHVTLWRKVSTYTPPEITTLVQWAVRDFVLARSESLATGVRYTVIRSWPLA